MKRSRLTSHRRLAIIGLLLAAAVLTAGAAVYLLGPGPPADFAGSQACAACHQPEYDLWRGSHHERALLPALEKNVLGDFNDAVFTHQGVTSRFFRRDGRFFVHTEGPEGEMQDFEIQYTIGYQPLQQYLVQFPGGRLQSLTIAWDTEKRRWFHLYPDERIPPEDPLHWTGPLQNWNYMCAFCHTTNLRKNYDPSTDTYDTAWSEGTVGCETCHGPGSRHVEWAQSGRLARALKRDGYGLEVRLKAAGTEVQLNSCAPCHARRHVVAHGYSHGRPFLDYFMPQLLEEGLYHPDGQILDEVYEYGSFLQSRMYREGVKCTDCHDPHRLEVHSRGNDLCASCHLPETYDSPAHHFHPVDSPGALCVECHMPSRTYMVVDPRRDHSFRVPRPDLSVKLGTPNACNQCHADETPEWAADWVVRWYGPKRAQDPHYGEILAAAWRGAPEATADLARLASDENLPSIVRASVVQILGRRDGSEAAGALQAAARDPADLVRIAAAAAMDVLPLRERLEVAAPLLEDPVRAVRVEAARVLAAVPAGQFSQDQARTFQAALKEYEAAQLTAAEQPAAHLNLGIVYADLGRAEDAERAYRRALRLEPAFVPALANLAQLYNRLGRNPEAERLLREVVKLEPDYGEGHYSLGLLLAEDPGRLAEAEVHLARAAELIPERARVHYNRGLALQYLERRKEAEAALLRAYELEPGSPDTLHALAVLYAQDERWEQAARYAEELARLLPGDPGVRRLLSFVQGRLGLSR